MNGTRGRRRDNWCSTLFRAKESTSYMSNMFMEVAWSKLRNVSASTTRPWSTLSMDTTKTAVSSNYCLYTLNSSYLSRDSRPKSVRNFTGSIDISLLQHRGREMRVLVPNLGLNRETLGRQAWRSGKFKRGLPWSWGTVISPTVQSSVPFSL